MFEYAWLVLVFFRSFVLRRASWHKTRLWASPKINRATRVGSSRIYSRPLQKTSKNWQISFRKWHAFHMCGVTFSSLAESDLLRGSNFAYWKFRRIWRTLPTRRRLLLGWVPQNIIYSFIHSISFHFPVPGCRQDASKTREPGGHGWGLPQHWFWTSRYVQMSLQASLSIATPSRLLRKTFKVSNIKHWIKGSKQD